MFKLISIPITLFCRFTIIQIAYLISNRKIIHADPIVHANVCNSVSTFTDLVHKLLILE